MLNSVYCALALDKKLCRKDVHQSKFQDKSPWYLILDSRLSCALQQSFANQYLTSCYPHLFAVSMILQYDTVSQTRSNLVRCLQTRHWREQYLVRSEP